MTAPKNSNLSAARKAKNDEFYTQISDITAELNAYLEYNPDIFRGKTILLPCDDPDWSNFTKYFATRFTELGIARLISTSYAPGSNPVWQADPAGYHPAAIEKASKRFDAEKTWTNGKIFELLPEDLDGDGRIDINDLRWDYLEDDGDFRSAEVTALRDKADFVVTNPPFSLFREFIGWLMAGSAENGLQFSIIGNQNAITYKEIFPLIRDNRIWLGNGFPNGNAYFSIPEQNRTDYAAGVYDSNTKLVKFRNAKWFTNMEHHKRHEPLQLLSMEENQLLHGKKSSYPNLYAKYENYDAIEIPRTNAIPSDYDGLMGVPITFLDKYNPDQFEILGASDNGAVPEKLKLTHHKKHNEPYIHGKKVYKRIFVAIR